MKNINKGINTVPQRYDGYDVLQKVVEKTIEGSHLHSGIFMARVINVVQETDPTSRYRYKIIARLSIDSVEEPEIYSMPEIKNVIGIESYFYPLNDDLDMPWQGATINIMLSDPYNRKGVYIGLVNEEFNNKDVLGAKSAQKQSTQTPQQSASKAFGD